MSTAARKRRKREGGSFTHPDHSTLPRARPRLTAAEEARVTAAAFAAAEAIAGGAWRAWRRGADKN